MRLALRFTFDCARASPASVAAVCRTWLKAFLTLTPSRTLLSNRRMHPTYGEPVLLGRRQERSKRDSYRFGKAFKFIPDLCVTFAGVAFGLLCRYLRNRRCLLRSPGGPGCCSNQQHKLRTSRAINHGRAPGQHRVAVLPHCGGS